MIEDLTFASIESFAEKFGKIAFLEGASSYDIDDMRELSKLLKENNYPILEVFDLYKNHDALKEVVRFDADTLIMGTTGLRPDTKILVEKGLEIAKDAGYAPSNIIDIPINEYFEFVADIFECNYYSSVLAWEDEINISCFSEKTKKGI